MDSQSRAQDSAPASRSLTSATVEPLLTRDFDARPALMHERLRSQHGAVAPVDLLGVPVWLVLGYAEVLEVLRNDQGVWSKRVTDWRALSEGRIPADWPLLPTYGGHSCMFQEGRSLTELRAAWSAGLRPFQDRSRPQARLLEAEVRRYADELISVMGEDGGTGWADLSAQYARPLAILVCNRLIGFDAGNDEMLMDMWRLVDAGPDAAEALARLHATLSDVVDAKRRHPGDDLPSAMLAARPDYTVDELAHEMILLIGVVGELVGSLICLTAVEVITGNTGARAALAAGMLRETVNRVATANPPYAHLTLRFATADTALGGTHIAAGDPVMLSVSGAHNDPRFADAADPSSVHSSRAHLAWGAGPHHCLGDELATTLVTIAVGRLFERFSGIDLALPADQLPWRSSPIVRGLRSLPVRFQLHEAPDGDDATDSDASGQRETPAEASEGSERSGSAISRLVRMLLRQGN
ncbi:cytochrome P450 [Thermomonospora umbrina]|uniref:Cytochrome P450 n=1 Tax=Thermomonospora umbrina TaxID=111806 RepID=A0A3D9SVL3_9ACTN|nr:cytochrome P450 [Thermomonospora umbrina]REE98540.1 cytochrome P450 [Thermomonospora umbrina]